MTVTALPLPASFAPPAATDPRLFAELARTQLAPRVEKTYRSESLDLPSWRRFAKEGLWRAGVPEHLGGHGGTWRDLALRLADIARHGGDLGFVLSLIAHAGLVRALTEYGGPWHHQHVLWPLLGGEVGATALTEPHGGSDVASTRTHAVKSAGGWLLSGLKDHITNAPVADRALVLGRIPALGRRDITLFLVDLRSRGIRRGPAEQLLGLRTSPTGAIEMHGVPVPENAVLGAPGEGLRTLYNVISFDRALYGLVSAAFLEPELAKVVAFAKERQAFGSPILDHQYVQGRITDIQITIETARATALAGIDALVAGDPEASLRCSVAKLVGSEGLVEAAKNLMVLHGHLGYMRGPQSRTMQDALGTLIAGGTSDMQRKNILNQLLAMNGS
ncbi:MULTISPECIES: acyl-CoA dehydrogenase family protein [unclassified Streptomyces]|uniref:acyl-CoA dehydrogenase family protein n=1 Tax=unclassified Streptomyces TaxID=2593676 RepID=UPI0022598EAA|nr:MULTISPECIES: acyl-CoA dehydrogenase family protein [unclassified Streptomyces]MCX4409533.1 acyl-CoA/acyl-ACP dehydrogenase [Streptomyces sp. NBC_01764]MCX5191303.1 acyl-CoA/acyl-ACP dehydrogenase [Streptomyces sp. NBC_00268]